MKGVIRSLGIAGFVFFLLSLLSFGLTAAGGVGLTSSGNLWVFWFAGLVFAGLAVVSVVSWGACCGLQSRRERNSGDLIAH